MLLKILSEKNALYRKLTERKDMLFIVAALTKRSGTKLESDYVEKVLLPPTHLLADNQESAKLKTVALLVKENQDTDFDRVEILVRPF